MPEHFDYFFIPHNDIVPYMDYHLEQVNLEVMENYNEFPETHLNILGNNFSGSWFGPKLLQLRVIR